MKTLHVIYRTNNYEANGEGNRPYRKHDGKKPYTGASPASERTEWFSKKTCMLSVLGELPLHCGLTVVFDGPQDTSWFKWVQAVVQGRKVAGGLGDLVSITNKNRLGSLHKALDLASTSDHPWLYLMEDDYLHNSGWFEAFSKIAEAETVQGIFSLYDHPDRYTRSDDVTGGLERVAVTSLLKDAIHLRTAEATTHTFFLSKVMFHEIKTTLYAHGHDRPMFRALITQGIRLWQTIPGYATHDHIDFLSPGVDWKQVSDKIKSKFPL